MTNTLKIATISLLLFACSQAAAISTFNVLGYETKTDFKLLFEISDANGVAFDSKIWTSAVSSYENETTAAMMKLMYWDVKFSYDAAKTKIHIEAFHKIDPHTSAADPGDTFVWDIVRPAATRTLPSGALRGLSFKSDYKEHDDSLGKHSDEYNATLAYTEGIADLPKLDAFKDIMSLEITGLHRSKPVPDFSSTASLLLLSILTIAGLKLKKR